VFKYSLKFGYLSSIYIPVYCIFAEEMDSDAGKCPVSKDTIRMWGT